MRYPRSLVAGWVAVLLGATTLEGTQTAAPAEQTVQQAPRATATSPQNPETLVAQAVAQLRRARETADARFLDQATQTIAKASGVARENFEVEKVRLQLLLARREFKDARDLARTLNKRVPDDVQVYGLLSEAAMALGDYKEAEEACQWMLDMRPGNAQALVRAGLLREVFGDVEGALDMITMAFQRTLPREAEERAWLLTHVGRLERLAGRLDRAQDAIATALEAVPNHAESVVELARVRTAQGRHREAVDLLKPAAAMGRTARLFELAEALRHAGRSVEATAAYAAFEGQALKESGAWDNANRELVLYYVDRAKRSADALRIAEAEIARRRDVHTLDVYAWALHANKRTRDAGEQMSVALTVGTKDPGILAHAAVINRAAPRARSSGR